MVGVEVQCFVISGLFFCLFVFFTFPLSFSYPSIFLASSVTVSVSLPQSLYLAISRSISRKNSAQVLIRFCDLKSVQTLTIKIVKLILRGKFLAAIRIRIRTYLQISHLFEEIPQTNKRVASRQSTHWRCMGKFETSRFKYKIGNMFYSKFIWGKVSCKVRYSSKKISSKITGRSINQSENITLIYFTSRKFDRPWQSLFQPLLIAS